MWPYPWTHVGTPSHLGHMDRVAATMPSQAHAGAAQEAPDIGQWKGQDVPLVRPSSCNVKGGIPSSRRYLPTYLLFTGVPAWCVVLLVRCPGPLGSCSPVCPRGLLCFACGVLGQLAPAHWCACSVCGFVSVVLGHLAPGHRCARVVCCVACAVSWATWFLFTGVPARCVVLLLRCPGPLGSCSPVCPRGLLCCVCGVLCQLAPVHRCARSVCGFVSVVLGHLAPGHRCARVVCCVACAVSWAT